MPESVAIKYRAFLSYSHADTGWAKWLHARLEGFRIDTDLVGRETPRGTVPNALRPIFRDRVDFSGGDGLIEATMAALDASAAIIVLCSPVAASRPNVNEEVRVFRARHPDRPVIPVMIAGDWPNNCPPALRFELDTDGSVSDRPITILGPDLREDADGKNIGLTKLVAGLIGLSPDDVYRRAERAQRRQNRLRASVGAAIVTLVIGGSLVAWHAQQSDNEIADAKATATQLLLSNPADASGPDKLDSLTQTILALAARGAKDPRSAQVLALLKARNPKAALELAEQIKLDTEIRAHKEVAEEDRFLGSIAGVTDPNKARLAYAEAAQLDPSDVSGMLQNGWFQQQAGQLDAAWAAYAHVLAIAWPGQDDEAIIWAQLGTGDIQGERGDVRAALATYQSAEAIADRLAKSKPDNAEWQRDLSVAYERIGDMQMAGDLTGALKSYQDSLAIRDRLAQSDLGRYDLSVTYEKIGDVLQSQGNFAGALTSYRNSLAIRERVANSDHGNVSWQRDLAVAFNKVGDVLMAQGDLPHALMSYRDSLGIRDRLTKSDDGNAEWQCELAGSLQRVGDVLLAQANLAGALKSYRDSLALVVPEAAYDPGDASWQRELAVLYEKVGIVLMTQGDLAGAAGSHRDSLVIRERLANSDPGNVSLQRDLAVSYQWIGNLYGKQGDLAGAEKSYGDSLAIRERLAQSDPDNAEWQSDLAVAYNLIGEVQAAQGDLAATLKSYLAGLAIREALVRNGGDNAEWQKDLQSSVGRIGDLAFKLILTRDFHNALLATDAAIRVAPDKIWLYTNRAHALMFLGRFDEAHDLYLRYRSEQNVLGRGWATVILDDFAEMHKEGLTNPMMDQVTQLLAR